LRENNKKKNQTKINSMPNRSPQKRSINTRSNKMKVNEYGSSQNMAQFNTIRSTHRDEHPLYTNAIKNLLDSTEKLNEFVENNPPVCFVGLKCHEISSLGKKIKLLLNREDTSIKNQKKCKMINYVHSLMKEYASYRIATSNALYLFNQGGSLDFASYHQFNPNRDIKLDEDQFVKSGENHFKIHCSINVLIENQYKEDIKNLSGDQVYAFFFNLFTEVKNCYHLYALAGSRKVNANRTSRDQVILQYFVLEILAQCLGENFESKTRINTLASSLNKFFRCDKLKQMNLGRNLDEFINLDVNCIIDFKIKTN
jgi:hypothetical protein